MITKICVELSRGDDNERTASVYLNPYGMCTLVVTQKSDEGLYPIELKVISEITEVLKKYKDSIQKPLPYIPDVEKETK